MTLVPRLHWVWGRTHTSAVCLFRAGGRFSTIPPSPFPPLGPWSHCSQRPWPGHDCSFIHTSSRRNTINTSSPSVLAAITTMENNNENNTEIITENTIGTFLTLLLIWSRSFKIRSSLNAGFFDFDVAQGLRHPAHVAYPCVCACHLISICTLATAHLSQVCRGQGPVPCWNTDGVLTLAKPFRTLVCKWARARGRGPSVSAPWDIGYIFYNNGGMKHGVEVSSYSLLVSYPEVTEQKCLLTCPYKPECVGQCTFNILKNVKP